MKTYIATDRYIGTRHSNRAIANMVIKALNRLTNEDNGTVDEPKEFAEGIADQKNWRNIIQVVLEDGEVEFNDGWFCIEVKDGYLYVDYTGCAIDSMRQDEDFKLKLYTNVEANEELKSLAI